MNEKEDGCDGGIRLEVKRVGEGGLPCHLRDNISPFSLNGGEVRFEEGGHAFNFMERNYDKVS